MNNKGFTLIEVIITLSIIAIISLILIPTVNTLIEKQGGQVVVVDGKVVSFLPLSVAGIVSDAEPEELAKQEEQLEEAAKVIGSNLPDPIFYLSFLPITAIPDLAITDAGPVDYTKLAYFDPILKLEEN